MKEWPCIAKRDMAIKDSDDHYNTHTPTHTNGHTHLHTHIIHTRAYTNTYIYKHIIPCRVAAVVERRGLAAWICPTHRSLGQFPLAQSTSEYCQSKIFWTFRDPALPQALLNDSRWLSHMSPKQRNFRCRTCFKSTLTGLCQLVNPLVGLHFPIRNSRHLSEAPLLKCLNVFPSY